ncbi:integrase [Bradyrhizobium sp. LM2.7]
MTATPARAGVIVRSFFCWCASACGPVTWRNCVSPISSGKRDRCGSAGKSRYEVRLPLPQDVGDAIAAYLECRPSTRRNDVLFLRTIAPCRPFRRGDGISSVVKRIMKRADIVPPVKGAHALRHTAATEMLRHGVPLDKIGLVLRHRGIDTTAYYAKADVALLKQVAQPWPEAL